VNAEPLSHGGVNLAIGRADDTIVAPRLMAFFRGCVVR